MYEEDTFMPPVPPVVEPSTPEVLVGAQQHPLALCIMSGSLPWPVVERVMAALIGTNPEVAQQTFHKLWNVCRSTRAAVLHILTLRTRDTYWPGFIVPAPRYSHEALPVVLPVTRTTRSTELWLHRLGFTTAGHVSKTRRGEFADGVADVTRTLWRPMEGDSIPPPPPRAPWREVSVWQPFAMPLGADAHKSRERLMIERRAARLAQQQVAVAQQTMDREHRRANKQGWDALELTWTLIEEGALDAAKQANDRAYQIFTGTNHGGGISESIDTGLFVHELVKRTNLIAHAENSILCIEDATSRLEFAESRSLVTESNKALALCELAVGIWQPTHQRRDIRSTLGVSRDLDKRLEACQHALGSAARRLEEMEGKGDAEEARVGQTLLGREGASNEIHAKKPDEAAIPMERASMSDAKMKEEVPGHLEYQSGEPGGAGPRRTQGEEKRDPTEAVVRVGGEGSSWELRRRTATGFTLAMVEAVAHQQAPKGRG
jgi:hypothetical protein